MVLSNPCGKVLIIVGISWTPDLRVQHIYSRVLVYFHWSIGKLSIVDLYIAELSNCRTGQNMLLAMLWRIINIYILFFFFFEIMLSLLENKTAKIWMLNPNHFFCFYFIPFFWVKLANKKVFFFTFTFQDLPWCAPPTCSPFPSAVKQQNKMQ